MAKQGQHHKDGNDPDVSRGHNNPRKSTPISSGTPKQRETYEAEAREHKDPGKRAQDHEPHWYEQTPKRLTKRDVEGRGRGGANRTRTAPRGATSGRQEAA